MRAKSEEVEDLKSKILSSLQQDTMIAFPYLRNYDLGEERGVTYEKVTEVWNLDCEILGEYSFALHGYEVRMNFDDDNGKQCLSFYTIKESELKRICSNGIGVPRRSLSHTNSIGRALEVLVDLN